MCNYFKEYITSLRMMGEKLKALLSSVINTDRDYKVKNTIISLCVCGSCGFLLESLRRLFSGQLLFNEIIFEIMRVYLVIFGISFTLEMVYRWSYRKLRNSLYVLVKPLMVVWLSLVFLAFYVPGVFVVSIIYALKRISADQIGNHLSDFTTCVGMSLMFCMFYTIIYEKIIGVRGVKNVSQSEFIFWIMAIGVVCISYIISLHIFFKDKMQAYYGMKQESRTLFMGVCLLLMLAFYCFGPLMERDVMLFYEQGINALTISLLFFSIIDRIENNNKNVDEIEIGSENS